MDDPSELETLRRRVAVLETQLEDRRREIEYWKGEAEAFADEMIAAQDIVADFMEREESRLIPDLTQAETNGAVDGVPLPDTRYANHVRNTYAEHYALWVDTVIHRIRRASDDPDRLSLRDIATELNKRRKNGEPRLEPTDDYLPTPNGRTVADSPGWTHKQVARVMKRLERALEAERRKQRYKEAVKAAKAAAKANKAQRRKRSETEAGRAG